MSDVELTIGVAGYIWQTLHLISSDFWHLRKDRITARLLLPLILQQALGRSSGIGTG